MLFRSVRPPVSSLVLRASGLVFWSPLVAVGIALGWVPYRLCGIIAERFGAANDVRATVKVLAGLVLFPFTWLLEAALMGWFFGGVAAVVTLLVAPAACLAAMRSQEELERFENDLRALVLQKFQRRVVRLLRQRREKLYVQLDELAEIYRTIQVEDDDPWTRLVSGFARAGA